LEAELMMEDHVRMAAIVRREEGPWLEEDGGKIGAQEEVVRQ
jgi:hypothetical protein